MFKQLLALTLLGTMFLSACAGTYSADGTLSKDGTPIADYNGEITFNEATPTGTATTEATATANGSPTLTLEPMATTTPVPASKHFVWGYGVNDKAVLEAKESCASCETVFIQSLDELPAGKLYTFNVASPTTNFPDGCRSADELKAMGVSLFIANDFTPCH